MKHAFSLVELSIVLVIIGLLVGGVMLGQNLIRAGEVRAVATEYQRYATAAHAFKQKYGALPGDMANATQYWNIAAGSTGSDTTCKNTVQTTGTATCNGDGNGDMSTDGYNGYESYLFWKHLVNAGLVEGPMAGTTAAAGGMTSPYTIHTTAVPGWNMPLSKLPNGTWFGGNLGAANVSIQKFMARMGPGATQYYYNSLYLMDKAKSLMANGNGPLSPAEVYSIDAKLDDGKPGSGLVETTRAPASNDAGLCLTNADPALAAYLLSNTNRDCAVVFVNAFLF